jgi:hypothetical protein
MNGLSASTRVRVSSDWQAEIKKAITHKKTTFSGKAMIVLVKKSGFVSGYNVTNWAQQT